MTRPLRLALAALVVTFPALARADIAPLPIAPPCTVEQYAEPDVSCMVCVRSGSTLAWCDDPARRNGFAQKCSTGTGESQHEVWCRRNEGSQPPAVASPPIERVPEPGESDGSAALAVQAAAAAAGSGERPVATAPVAPAAEPDAGRPSGRGCAGAPVGAMMPAMAAIWALVLRRRRSP